MKRIYHFIILICLPLVGITQDSTILIDQTILSTDTTEINIGRMQGWLYKKGHQPTWANETIDLNGWEKMRPDDLSIKDADKNGRVEGWFRLKIKMEHLSGNFPVGFKYNGWGAAEIYLDGNLIQLYGSTGTDLQTFREYNPVHRLAIPITLEPDKEHILAIHFVDYVSNFPLPKKIKTFIYQTTGPYTFSNALFSLNGSNYNIALEKKVYQHMILKISLFAIILIITTLFWLISYQNPAEINLRLISIYGTIGVLATLERILWHSQTAGFGFFLITQTTQPLLGNIATGLLPMILSESLQQPIKPYLKKLLVLGVIIGIYSYIFFNNTLTFTIPYFIFNAIGFVITGKIIYNSRKTLKGAQWSIVIGFCAALLSGFIVALIKPSLSFSLYVMFECITYLSIPVAYLIYISIRFREIIQNVKDNAAQLVLVSEEKNQLIARQNEMLELQVAERTSALHQSLEELKATQKQLIQSEKMASLGELTAGIAHEIQNPLNFVNNFSEVSLELMEEVKTEKLKVNSERDEALENELLNDIATNLEKINHHGKRAGDIVKGMLQHSRSSSGIKEPTDINALADEYLRLAYHGLRAKDKDFNVTLLTDYDQTIGKVNVIPQDIGRVILNLINNAFYASSAKASATTDKFDPTVWVSTKRAGDSVLISVKDNGTGIPQNILDKIFQPFFTTKPTGQGTGLGLSLSYDIVKAHGGELKVKTKEGEGTGFIIELSAQK